MKRKPVDPNQNVLHHGVTNLMINATQEAIDKLSSPTIFTLPPGGDWTIGTRTIPNDTPNPINLTNKYLLEQLLLVIGETE